MAGLIRITITQSGGNLLVLYVLPRTRIGCPYARPIDKFWTLEFNLSTI